MNKNKNGYTIIELLAGLFAVGIIGLVGVVVFKVFPLVIKILEKLAA